MIQQISLNQIVPNPFQTRGAEDPEHIQALIFSIKAHGLLQIPSARPFKSPDGYDLFQLAFGHSRYAAFVSLGSSGLAEFQTMPLNISPFTDLEMFEAAVAENLDRKALSPIEEARAMQLYRDQFSKTSVDIGALFHLSDSAVRNKIRLLGLPDFVQEAMTAGRVTEGAGRALLAFYALPEEIRKRWLQTDISNLRYYRDGKDNDLVRQALAGEIGAEEIASRLARARENNSINLMESLWKYDDELKADDVRSITCRACSLRSDNRCLDPQCHALKKQIHVENYLYLASHATGMKSLETERWGYGDHSLIQEHYSWSRTDKDEEAKSAAIIAGACENLRIKFDDSKEPVKDAVHPFPDYPHATIVCKNHNGTCRCLAGYDALKKGQPAQVAAAHDSPIPGKVEMAIEPDRAVSAETVEPAAIPSADVLRRAAADEIKAKQNENKTAVKLMALAGQLLGQAVIDGNDRALVYLISSSGMYSGQADLSKTSTETAQLKALQFFKSNLEWSSLGGWLSTANRILEACNLPQLTTDDVDATAGELLARVALPFESAKIETL